MKTHFVIHPSMAELKKRKKSLNQIVNPSISNKQTFFLQNPPLNTTSFRPLSSKNKIKKIAIANANASTHYSYSNLIPLKAELSKDNSRKAFVKIFFFF